MYEALICHLIGDFCLQNDWMASKKRLNSFRCAVHVAVYTLVFLAITRSIPALLLIAGTHFLIDRFGLALRWCEFYGVGDRWERTLDMDTGKLLYFRPADPAWKNFWLVVVVDQTLHLLCNYLILRYFGG